MQLAQLLEREEMRLIASRPGVIVGYLARGRNTPQQARKRLLETAAALAEFATVPSLEAEARLRRGILLFDLNDIEKSLADLAVAERAMDPFVRYLAYLISGFGLETVGRDAEALAAFEMSVTTIPNAASGIMALAARLFVNDGRRSEAAVLLQRWPSGQPRDPWRDYRLADFRFLPDYLQTLRRSLLK